MSAEAEIEAAAQIAGSWGVKSGHGGWTDRETQRHCAEDILAAVEPLIRERLAQEVEALVHDEQYSQHSGRGAFSVAARIVHGDAS